MTSDDHDTWHEFTQRLWRARKSIPDTIYAILTALFQTDTAALPGGSSDNQGRSQGGATEANAPARLSAPPPPEDLFFAYVEWSGPYFPVFEIRSGELPKIFQMT